ncbi:hypothetical protein O7626_02970 [Micromonospora sp. WMMD1102]|uniref:hypothetical protein n=1 Tax=Micromonospora sp. WMMD1102 TaxID=3016105 RepID=UPI00241562DC|nr:hypothetical protein [Micromonospora sp. WMMD1102]MDG4784902.1 hypothetical protein [Micromonospora sp. WMMD1102]
MTAQGKKTTTGLVRGDRILITDDPAKASTRTRGDWHPSRVKTGATAATVLDKQAISGRRTRYNVVTDAGSVLDLSGGQTFLLAPPAPSSEPTGAAATIVLPHTGLGVPHGRLSARDLRHRDLGGSRVGYSAVLYLDEQVAGRILNDYGTDTWFEPVEATPFGEADLAAFVGQCRDEDGATVTVETVLDALIDEQEAADAVRQVLTREWTPVRLLTPIQPAGQGHGHVKGLPFGAGAPADRTWWGAIVRALHHKRPLNDGEIYQIWTGQVWEALPSIEDVTRVERPGGAQ